MSENKQEARLAEIHRRITALLDGTHCPKHGMAWEECCMTELSIEIHNKVMELVRDLLQQPASERCGERLCIYCKRSGADNPDYCGKQRGLQKCVFPATGTPNFAITELLRAALEHPESAEGNIRQAIEMMVATTDVGEGTERPPTEATQVAVEAAARDIASHVKGTNPDYYSTDHGLSDIREIISGYFPSRISAGTEAAAREIYESHASQPGDGLSIQRDVIQSIAAIISRHCSADAGEVERLEGELRKLKAKCLHEHVPLDTWIAVKKERDGARANAIEELRDIIEAKQAEWEKLGDYGINRGYVYRIQGSNEILAALESLTKKEGDDGPQV